MSEFVTTSKSRTVTAHGIFNSNIIEKNKSIDKACTELTREGFKVKGNDHKKIYYQNDGRYMCTLACTPSDCLTTKNTLHDTIDILFK